MTIQVGAPGTAASAAQILQIQSDLAIQPFVGTFATPAALTAAAAPALNTGALALVGASAPYTQYRSDGVAWIAGLTSPKQSAVDSLIAVAGSLVPWIRQTDVDVALQSGGYVPVGDFTQSSPLLVGPNTVLDLRGVLYVNGGYARHAIKTSNADYDGTSGGFTGLQVLWADTQAAGSGTLRNASNVMYWTAPGDTEGAGVSVAAGGWFKLPSGTANKALYVCVPTSANLPGAGSASSPIKVSSVRGAVQVSAVRASGVAVVTQTGHTRKVGEYVAIAAPSTHYGHFKIIAADATTYSYADSRGDVGATTVDLFATENISIISSNGRGVYDAGQLTSTGKRVTDSNSYQNRHAVMAFFVGGLFKVQDVTARNVSKYCVLTVACSNAVLDYKTENSTDGADGYHADGPMGSIDVTIRGRNHDNMVGIGTSNYPVATICSPTWPGGTDVERVIVRRVESLGSDLDVVRFFGAASARFKYVEIQAVLGKVNDTLGVSANAFNDPVCVDGTAVNIDQLVVRNLAMRNSKSQDYWSGTQFAMSGNVLCNSLELRDITCKFDSATYGNPTAGYVPAILRIEGGVVNQVTMRNCHVIDTAASGQQATMFNHYGGQVDHILFDGCTINGAHSFYYQQAVATLIPKSIKWHGCKEGNATKGQYWANVRGTWDLIEAVGCVTENPNSWFVWLGSGVPNTNARKVRGAGNNLNATQMVKQNTAGVLVDISGSDFAMDITLAKRVDGNLFYNTNAAANNGTDGACGTGLFACVGTAVGSFKRVGTTGGAGNQY